MADRQISETAKQLIEAKRLIETPDRWCRGVLHQNGRFCAVGAIYEAGAVSSGAMSTLEKAALDLYGGRVPAREAWAPLTWINDKLGHAAVMKMFDLAISREMAKGDAS